MREMEYRCSLFVFASADLNSFQKTGVLSSSPRQIKTVCKELNEYYGTGLRTRDAKLLNSDLELTL